MTRRAVSASPNLIKSNTDARAFATTLIQPHSGFLGGCHVDNYTKNNARTDFFTFFLCRFYWPLALRTATSKAKNDHWSNGNGLGRIWYALVFEPQHDFGRPDLEVNFSKVACAPNHIVSYRLAHTHFHAAQTGL